MDSPRSNTGSRGGDSLSIEYATHGRVARLRDVLTYLLEEISLEFDRWDEERVHGPGVYVAIVCGPTVAAYADPMGDNCWPADASRDVLIGEVAEPLTEVAYGCDGALVVSVDGVVNPQLVRFGSVDTVDHDFAYAPWMGSRHMSALDVSTLPEVVATLTLSEESGRVTVFEGGTFESVPRADLGGQWRTE